MKREGEREYDGGNERKKRGEETKEGRRKKLQTSYTRLRGH